MKPRAWCLHRVGGVERSPESEAHGRLLGDLRCEVGQSDEGRVWVEVKEDCLRQKNSKGEKDFGSLRAANQAMELEWKSRSAGREPMRKVRP